MAIGMTYDQYWFGDPLMVRAFYKTHKLRQEMQNEVAWINGLYVLQALQATVGNMLKKKTDKANEYPSKPLEFGQSKAGAKNERDEKLETDFAKAYMMQMVFAGKNWGKEK